MKKTVLQFMVLLLLLFILIPGIMGQAPKLISLDFKDTDIKDVLRVLANQSKVSIIVDEQTNGKVTIHLSRVSLAEALEIITKNYKLTCVKSGNVYYVAPVDNSFLKIEYQEGLLSVEAREVSLKKLFQEISKKTGVNLVPAPDLQGKLSTLINRSPLQDAIKTLLTQSNCMEEKIGKNSYIRKKTTQPYTFTVNYVQNLLTIDAKNIPIAILARAITEKTGISVIPEQNLTDNVTIYFQDLPFDEGMEALCLANNFKYFKEGQSRRIARKNGAYRVTYKNSLLSIDADNVEIGEIIGEISRKTNINIMLDQEVNGKVTAHFQALPIFQALMLLVENQGWYIEKQSNCYFVKPSGAENKDARIIFNPDTQLFNLDVKSGSLASIINEMARKANLNVVILTQVNWTISNLRLREIKFDEALNYMLKGTIYTYKVSNGVYMVGDGLMTRPEVHDFAEVKVYPLKYLRAEQLLNSLPPIFPRQNFMQLPNKNTLIVSAPPSIQALFQNYLDQIDVTSAKDETAMIKIKYLKAEDVMKMIPSSIPKNDLVVIKESNAIVVTGPKSHVAQVKSYIETIDQVTPLIVFDIAVLQVNDSHGFDWKAPIADIKLPNGNRLNINSGEGTINVTKPAKNFDSDGNLIKDTESTVLGAISVLLKTGKAKLLANPTISTLAGYPASFNVSTNESHSFAATKNAEGETTSTTIKEYKSGLFFQIVPWVSPNKQITMEIKPKITQFTGQKVGDEQLPIINERASETTIRVGDGETFVISGLKQTEQNKSKTKIPILGDIPLIGYLFRGHSTNESQNEFVIIITPKLIYDEADKMKNSAIMEQRFNVKELLNSIEGQDINNKAKPKTRKRSNRKTKFKPETMSVETRKFQRGRFN